MSILSMENLTFSYNKNSIKVINDLSFSFNEGKIYAVVGKSGAGKTTLLSLLSGLANPTDGRILLNNKEITKLDKYKYRSKYIGVVFQSFNLLPKLTAAENVILSMDISRRKFKNKKEYALQLLEKVGLSPEEANRRVLTLSGGQQQRVAIARTLSYDPKIILADEPTGNLDGETQNAIMDIFKNLAHNDNKCIIIVTHSPNVAGMSDEVLEISRNADEPNNQHNGSDSQTAV